jgi:hypothetical protein
MLLLLSLFVLLLLFSVVRQLLDHPLHMIPTSPFLLLALGQGACRLLLSLLRLPCTWVYEHQRWRVWAALRGHERGAHLTSSPRPGAVDTRLHIPADICQHGFIASEIMETCSSA